MATFLTALLASAVTFLGGGVSLFSTRDAGVSTARAATFPVSVSGRPVTRPLASNFLGLAFEYRGIPQWFPKPGQAADTVLPVLVKNLSPTGRPSIRIGGQTTDRSWWPVRGAHQPIGVTYTLGPGWTDAADALEQSTDARLLLGVNLEAGSPLLARVEADDLVKRIGPSNVAALEIGNEPNLYRFTPWYRESDGHTIPWYSKTGAPVYSRPVSWDPAAFQTQFNQFAKVMPDLPLSGPETNPGPYLTAFGSELSPHSRVRMLTAHGYGLNSCDKYPDDPLYPTVPHLLTLTASRGLFGGLGPSIALAHRNGATLRVDEMGSVTCNGRLGVSNTFATSLWAMDALFDAARIGVDGVNLHSFPEEDNDLFDFTYEATTHRWRGTVRPLYLGALMFAQAAPAGSRLLHLVTPAQTTVRAWATLGADHKVRVLLVNDGGSAIDVPIHAPAGYGRVDGTIERLQGPGPSATGGITLGGHRFSSTLTGKPPSPELGTVTPHDGVDTVAVPATSAALVTIPTG